MSKVKNNSHTLFRWQEYIWRPGEVIDMGNWEYERILAETLCSENPHLELVKDEETVSSDPLALEDEKRKKMLARLEKARAARKSKK